MHRRELRPFQALAHAVRHGDEDEPGEEDQEIEDDDDQQKDRVVPHVARGDRLAAGVGNDEAEKRGEGDQRFAEDRSVASASACVP